MRALVLCAGKGTRLGDFANGQPKPLIKVGGHSSLFYILRKLERLGVDEIIVNTHMQHSSFVSELATYDTSMKIHLHNESKLLGTFGTLKLHIDWLSRSDFWVLHGDNFFQDDLSKMASGLETLSPDLKGVIGSFKSIDFRNIGIVKRDKRGTLKRIHEKSRVPLGRTANAAIYLFKSSICGDVKEIDMSTGDISYDLLPNLIGKVKVVPLDGYFVDIGTPNKLTRAIKLANLE